jgi:protocatechuate 3,4-dioxygenase beta subunit
MASRARVSRRRALGLGGSIGLGALLAACSNDTGDTDAASAEDGATVADGGGGTEAPTASTTASPDLVELLDTAGTCSLTREMTQGPYWFDVDSIRSDIREDRPGTTLQLALRVWNAACEPMPNSVVEIWHCDAGGVYSGFEVASTGGANGGGPGAGSGGPGGGRSSGDDVSDGAYSEGVQEASPADDGTYLRGAQVADESGIVQFTTVYPGWYRSRTVHIHLKVHVDRENVLTTQLFLDDELSDAVFDASPYDEHPNRDTYNNTDTIYDATGLLSVTETDNGYLGYLNLGVDV